MPEHMLSDSPQLSDTLAETDPAAFCRLVASLLPRDVKLDVGVGDALSVLLERMNVTRLGKTLQDRPAPLSIDVSPG